MAKGKKKEESSEGSAERNPTDDLALIDPAAGLTEKEKRFCEEWVIDWNGARAARAAGYSEDSAKQIAHENLTKPYLRAYIEHCKQNTEELAGVSKLRTARMLADIAYTSSADLRDGWHEVKSWDEIPDDIKGIISEVKTETRYSEEGIPTETLSYKTYDRMKAADLLNKMFGHNAVEKKEVTLKGAIIDWQE